jgi:hypothetical protein
VQKESGQYTLELLRPALLDQAPGEVQNTHEVITMLEFRVGIIEDFCSDHHRVTRSLAKSLQFC